MKLLVTLESLPALSPLPGLLKLGYKRKKRSTRSTAENVCCLALPLSLGGCSR